MPITHWGGGAGRRDKEWQEGLLELMGLTYHSSNPKGGQGLGSLKSSLPLDPMGLVEQKNEDWGGGKKIFHILLET